MGLFLVMVKFNLSLAPQRRRHTKQHEASCAELDSYFAESGLLTDRSVRRNGTPVWQKFEEVQHQSPPQKATRNNQAGKLLERRAEATRVRRSRGVGAFLARRGTYSVLGEMRISGK